MTTDQISQCIYDLIFYCIGSKLYKEQNAEKFNKALGSLDPMLVTLISERLHISTLLYYELKRNKFDIDSFHLEPIVLYHKILNSLFLNELKLIKNKIQNRFYPVILKGPSFWEELYTENYLRRVEDLDILITNKKDIKAMSRILEDISYINEDENYYNQIDNPSMYELSPFYKEIPLIISPQKYRLLEVFYKNYEPMNLKKKSNGTFYFLCKVEIHKYIYKFKQSSLNPVINKHYLIDCCFMSGFKSLNNCINLPYLSLKFLSDASEYMHGNTIKLKCVKLISDFVRIIVKVNNEEVKKSIEISKKLKLNKHYFHMVNLIQDLTPENSYSKINVTTDNPLIDILSRLIKKELTI